MDNDTELKQQIGWFLKEFKNLMDQGHFSVNGNHLKNAQALAHIGLTNSQRYEIIRSLEVKDFSTGPHKDEYHPGNFWVFGKCVDENEIYIKLKIVPTGNEHAICYSFHLAEFPMKYPFCE